MNMGTAEGSMARYIGAFIIAVLASGLAATAVGSFWIIREGAFRANQLFGLWFMVTCVAAFCATAFGIPIFCGLAALKREFALGYIVAGFAVGLIPGYVMIGREQGTEALFICLSGGIPGAVCGLVWWLLARRHTGA
ncbi:hypothetical protein LZ518_11960 [Sphingomonas sp. RB56-2]|uniref:Uncharacterized protein n=1 Tax=Sphingomonas brevis TaxID=2908206 RepID=A0ABT0SBP6_9SPHN|nr:hypothetical protein [Sphingomonas brevis]MCL6741841.1 hypothetical protein [Sphingomonas brevis]